MPKNLVIIIAATFKHLLGALQEGGTFLIFFHVILTRNLQGRFY